MDWFSLGGLLSRQLHTVGWKSNEQCIDGERKTKFGVYVRETGMFAGTIEK